MSHVLPRAKIKSRSLTTTCSETINAVSPPLPGIPPTHAVCDLSHKDDTAELTPDSTNVRDCSALASSFALSTSPSRPSPFHLAGPDVAGDTNNLLETPPYDSLWLEKVYNRALPGDSEYQPSELSLAPPAAQGPGCNINLIFFPRDTLDGSMYWQQELDPRAKYSST